MATPYVVPNDIREALAPDGDVVGTAGELNDEQLARHITRGQELVDATTGFTFPDGNAPALVAGLVLALGSFYATLAYRKGKELSQFHPVYLQYQDARMTLQQIKQGLLDITPSTDTDEPAVRPGPSKFQPPGTQGIELFPLDESGLAVRCGAQGPTIDPALEAWGII